MIRKLALVFAAFFVTGYALATIYHSVNREEFSISLPQIVQVRGVCSGFIVDYGFVVTARHCVEAVLANKGPVDIKFFDGMHYDFTVLTVGNKDEKDFAILAGDTRGIKPFKMIKTIPESGTVCAHIGHGGGSAQQLLIPCLVEGETKWNPGYITIHSNAIGGDSGSAVLTMDGEVFGVLVRSGFPIPVTFAVKAKWVIEALEEIKK